MLQPEQALLCAKMESEISPPAIPLSAELMQKDALHALGENAAAVLHELRGPLQAIRAHVQLLERKTSRGGDEALARHYLPIYQGIDHVNDLLEQFLRLSRLMPASLTQLDLSLAVRELLPLLRSMAVMRGIELTAEIATGLPSCQGDEQQLKRLLFNLFANACDALAEYTGEGDIATNGAAASGNKTRQPEIRLLLTQKAGKLVLSVSDNGCGIAADKQDKIWQPFYTQKAGGTGLGLPSCLGIAAEHGGTLTLTSKPGQGSCFTLRLPYKKKPK